MDTISHGMVNDKVENWLSETIGAVITKSILKTRHSGLDSVGIDNTQVKKVFRCF